MCFLFLHWKKAGKSAGKSGHGYNNSYRATNTRVKNTENMEKEKGKKHSASRLLRHAEERKFPRNDLEL